MYREWGDGEIGRWGDGGIGRTRRNLSLLTAHCSLFIVSKLIPLGYAFFR